MSFFQWLMQTMFPLRDEPEPEPGWADMPQTYEETE